MSAGKLVPDEVVVGIVRERIAEKGDRDRSEDDELDGGDDADGDRRPAPGPDHIEVEVLDVLHARSEFVPRGRAPSTRSDRHVSSRPDPGNHGGDCPRHVPPGQVRRWAGLDEMRVTDV